MYPKSIQKLIELFSKLPGVGPRQATRMAFFVLREEGEYANTLKNAIAEVQNDVGACKHCFRSIQKSVSKQELCKICQDEKRDKRVICLVEKEVDITNLEKTNAYNGVYHVLGGTVSFLDKESPERLRLKDLYRRVEELASSNGPLELIIAVSPTMEGDSTALYIKRVFEPIVQKFTQVIVSTLGRGLSLGAEVEYADQITLESALKNRTKN